MGEKNLKLALLIILALLSMNTILATENQTTSPENQTIYSDNQTSFENGSQALEEPILEDPIIELDISSSSIELGEETLLEIGIDPKERDINKIKIDWDDNDENTITSFSLSNLGIYLIDEEHKYEEDGTFEIQIDIYCSNEVCASESISVEVEEKEIIDEEPTVTLISPSDKYTSKQDSVEFTFKATDDNKINSCTFELYKKDEGLKKLEYTDTQTDPPTNENIKLPLQEFDDGNYSWYVICEDNNSQEDEKSRDLIIKTVNHPREKEIFAMIDQIDDFLEEKKKMSPEEQEILEQLEKEKIIELKYYKKRLIQINQDLGHNLKTMSDKTLIEKRKAESNLEIDEIKEKIPTNFELINDENFVKNSPTNSMQEIANRYIDSQNIELSQNKIKRLAKNNEEFQSKLTIETSIKQIRITYNESEETITLVKKSISISDPEIETLIEVFPENFDSKIEFTENTKHIGNNLYKIKLEDLNNFEIQYIINEKINIGIIKETETIIFKENALSGNLITGFSIFDGEINQNSIYIITGLLIFMSLIAFKNKFLPKKNKWKKDSNTNNTIELIDKAKENIKENDIAKAKEKYHKIKEIFKLLPEDFKQSNYEEIEKIRIEIDKFEIKNLIREYENAKKENRTLDANKLYKQISTKYKRLPKKYQEKVYKRIIN